MQVIEDSLRRRLIFITGKGGVGKSTLSWSLASVLASKGRHVAVASWSCVEPPRTTDDPKVTWVMLETMSCFKEYALRTLKFEAIYSAIFENPVLKKFILAAPGLGDTVIAGKIADLAKSGKYDQIIVDLPSTGHTLGFFRSLIGVRKLFRKGYVHNQAERILEQFTSAMSRVDIVAIPTEFSVTEALELRTKLSELIPLPLGFCWVNQLLPEISMPSSFLGEEELRVAGQYRLRKLQQEQFLAPLEAIQLPRISLPRFPGCSGGGQLLNSLMKHLENL